MAVLEALAISDPPELWRSLGFSVDGGGTLRLGDVAVELGVGEDGAGIAAWRVGGVQAGAAGLATVPARDEQAAATWTGPDDHPNGVIGVDHVVVRAPDVDRTTSELVAAGFELRGRHELEGRHGPWVQAILRLDGGGRFVEVAGVPVAGEGEPELWGLTVVAADIDATARLLGDRLRPVRPAAQRGRRIAILDRAAGSGVALAVMSPRPERVEAP